ncbi:MAG: Gfo/Idh/MocA family oxidoreductase, partial [Actinobacteria bacterium]|nr:Gfo/Idh/MocA family oxidoreductase [Actinomycetota bacterium]
MSTVYRAGIIGLSAIGMRRPAPDLGGVIGDWMPHTHASAYAALPCTQVTAVCDLVSAKGDDFKATWGDVWPEVRCYTDHRTMLASESLDIVSVVTSDFAHADPVVDAASAGVRAIACEKPLATTLADADRMIAAVERHGAVMSVDHSKRWRPEWLRARAAVRAGAIGHLRTIVASMGGGRSMLFRNGCHLIDSVVFFAESEPVWVLADADDAFAAYGPRYAADGGRDPMKDPALCGYVRFANGVRAFLNQPRGGLPRFELELVGDGGILRIGETTGQAAHIYTDASSAEDKRIALHAFNEAVYARRSLPYVPYTRSSLVGLLNELVQVLDHGGTTT